MRSGFTGGGVFRFTLWRPVEEERPEGWRIGDAPYYIDGKVHHRVWFTEEHNMVVNEGLQHMLDVLFAECAQTTVWHVGLVNTGETIASTDTLASHGGWTENTSYTGNRKEFVDVRTNQAVTNSASVASFSINTAASISGGFLCSPSTGTSGKLLCAVTFTGGDKGASDGDTLEVTYSFSAADDGA